MSTIAGDNINIWRCELPNGIGLYSGGVAGQVFDDDENHPAPDSDPLLEHLFDEHDTHLAYFYGFNSPQSCLCWVYKEEWLKELHALGIVISVYVCPCSAVVHGTKQSVFREHVSKTQHSLVDYFRLNLEHEIACTI